MMALKGRLAALLRAAPLDADDLRAVALAVGWLTLGTVVVIWAALMALLVRWLWGL